MKNILEEVKGAKTVAIGGHIRPDGDCIGSCMGLYLYLKKELPDTKVNIFLEKPADVFSCISRLEDIREADAEDTTAYDVFIALDCTKDRLGSSLGLFERAVKTINIDHHISNGGCNQIWLCKNGHMYSI